jgi:hypothetical protein
LSGVDDAAGEWLAMSGSALSSSFRPESLAAAAPWSVKTVTLAAEANALRVGACAAHLIWRLPRTTHSNRQSQHECRGPKDQKQHARPRPSSPT